MKQVEARIGYHGAEGTSRKFMCRMEMIGVATVPGNFGGEESNKLEVLMSSMTVKCINRPYQCLICAEHFLFVHLSNIVVHRFTLVSYLVYPAPIRYIVIFEYS